MTSKNDVSWEKRYSGSSDGVPPPPQRRIRPLPLPTTLEGYRRHLMLHLEHANRPSGLSEMTKRMLNYQMKKWIDESLTADPSDLNTYKKAYEGIHRAIHNNELPLFKTNDSGDSIEGVHANHSHDDLDLS